MTSRFNVIALDRLGRMAVLEDIDSEVTIADRMTRLKQLWAERDPPAFAQYDTQGLEFDPVKINQEAGAFFELLLRDRVNQAARALTLAFASGTDLDAIASRYPGGMPRLPGESDDRYRRRVWLSPNALSPHGTAEAYVLWALTADPTLTDATATSPEGTGEVVVTILPGKPPLDEDGFPTGDDTMVPTIQQILQVRAYIMDANAGRKALTDILTVRAPKVVRTRYHIRVWLFPGPDPDEMLRSLNAAMAELIEEQRWLGFDHTLTAIHGTLSKGGVPYAEIVEPAADVIVDQHGVVKVTEVLIEYKGRRE